MENLYKQTRTHRRCWMVLPTLLISVFLLLCSQLCLHASNSINIVNGNFEGTTYVDGNGNTVPTGWVFQIVQKPSTANATCTVVNNNGNHQVQIHLTDTQPPETNNMMLVWLYADDPVIYSTYISGVWQTFASCGVDVAVQNNLEDTYVVNGNIGLGWIDYFASSPYNVKTTFKGVMTLEDTLPGDMTRVMAQSVPPAGSLSTGLTGRMKPNITFNVYEGASWRDPYDVTITLDNVAGLTDLASGSVPPGT